MDSKRPYSTWAIYLRMVQQIRPYWVSFAILLGLSALGATIVLLAPLPLKIVVDSVLGSHALPAFLGPFVPSWIATSSTATLWLAVSLLMAIALLGVIRELGSWVLQEYLGEKIVLEFRSKLFEHVSQLSLAQHDSRGGGDFTYRIQYDAAAPKWLMEGAVLFVTAFLTLASMLFVILRLNVRLGLIALIIVPVIITLIRIYSPRLRRSWSRVKSAETNALSVVQEVIGAIRVVKAFGQERREQGRLFKIARQGMLERMRVTVVEGEFNLLICTVLAGGTAMVLFAGAEAVRANQLTTGDLVLIMAYIAQLYTPLYTMGKQIGAFQSSVASAERTFAILDERPAVVDVSKPKPLVRANGNFAFDDVSFSYESERWALRNISFDVPAGSTVGIIGKTGAGKTTLVNLLTRFYDPSKGTIFLDGDDLRNYRIADLRSQFSIMLQEPVLFPTSIAENIAYGTPGASHDSVITAAKAAYAHEFIVNLPEGYDTLVGDRGVRLSGGERQRVSLARAFIKDSPLLILDEPTSSIDMDTEKQIVDATLRLIVDRTTFIIAHRQSTLRRCDMLLLLKQGQLIQLVENPQAGLQDFYLDEREDRIVDSSEATHDATQAVHVDFS